MTAERVAPQPPAEDAAFFVGDVALDEYYTAERWPGVGDKAMIRPTGSYVGGMIANAAAVHAGYGAPTQFISLLNRRESSRLLCADLEASGVGIDHMLHDDDLPDSKTIVVLVGDEHAVLIPEMGNAPMVLPDETLAAMRRPGFLYSTLGRVKRLRARGMGALEVLAALREAGRRVVFDLDVEGMELGDEAYIRGAHIVIVNRVGFGATFGAWDDGRILEWLDRLGIGMLVVTLGPEGCRAMARTGAIAVPGMAVPVVDVTGAGDTFGGSLVYAMSRTNDPEIALRFANAAAAASITREGPRTGITTAARVLDVMTANGLAVGPEFDCLR